jgi:hypothetical protein
VEEYVNKQNLKHFSVSAKNGDQINEMFQSLAEEIWMVKEKNGTNSKVKSRFKIKIEEDIL